MAATSNSGVLNHHESQLPKEEEETQSPNGTISSPSQNPIQKQQEGCDEIDANASTAEYAAINEALDSMLTQPLDKERYLCISDGFVIRLLDLRQSKNNQSNCGFNDLPPLPEISTLNLLDKGLPILGCLFKLGSDVHMIGGRKFPTFDNANHWGMHIFGSLSMVNGLKGTSLVTYRLSLVGGNLSMSECNHIKPLNKPKGWPKVEKMGGKLHVMECFPGNLFDSYNTPTPTHEVLDLNDIGGGWDEIQHLDLSYESDRVGALVGAHMVVSDWIHALAQTPQGYHNRPLGFDAKTEAWVKTNAGISKCDDPFSIEHVAEILKFGGGRCVGGSLPGELSNSLYMVFAIIEHNGCVHAVVYLVVITGQILCFQRLPRFFEGFVGPASVMDSMVINTDEEEEKTMCAIIEGKAVGDLASGCLFVYTFNVEELRGAGVWIRDLWKRRVLEENAFEKMSLSKLL